MPAAEIVVTPADAGDVEAALVVCFRVDVSAETTLPETLVLPVKPVTELSVVFCWLTDAVVIS